MPKHGRPGTETEVETIKRECLKCDKTFLAEGRFIRVCPRCKGKSDWRGSVEVPSMELPARSRGGVT